MHILLPPSETKRTGGDQAAPATAIPEFGDAARVAATRASVRTALDALMSDPESAVTALKLGVKSRGELAHNAALDTSGRMPAVQRYTGVLYDALDVASLDDLAVQWIDTSVSVQSALFGLVRADAPIPAYRLSAGTRLPQLGGPLHRVWSATYADARWESLGWVLDLRSKDYVALAPLPAHAGMFCEIVQRADDGSIRALNHFNKATKGRLTRLFATERPEIHDVNSFAAWAATHGIEVAAAERPGMLTVIVPASLHR